MSWALLFLVGIAIVVAAVNVRATYVLLTDDFMTRAQRVRAGLVVWLLPIIGALLVLALHERRVVPPVSTQLAADKINPLVKQRLEPIADGATHAAERVIEQEVLDTITGHGTHTSSHDPS